MQTEYLRDFLMIAKTLNYGKAARNLYVSRSSLFKHIKALEMDLGGALFEKDGQKLALSPLGHLLVPHAAHIVNEEGRCIEELSTWLKESEHQVRVASEYRIWSSVYSFQKKFPEYHFQYMELNSIEETEEMLSRGTCDFVLLCDAELDENKFEKIPFRTDYLAAVLPVQNPLADSERLTLSELANESFVMLPESSPHSRYVDEIIERSGITPNVVLVCPRGNFVVECIAENGGCSILLENLTKKQNNSAVSLVRLEPEIEIHIDIWKLKNRKLLPAAKTFLDFVLNEDDLRIQK